MKLDPLQMNYFLGRQIDPTLQRKSMTIIAKGLPAGYGVSSGRVAFTAHVADEMTLKGEVVVYCIESAELTKDDIFAIRNSCVAVVALCGNAHSEVATLCRGLGKPCITDCKQLTFATKDVRILIIIFQVLKCTSVLYLRHLLDITYIPGARGTYARGKVGIGKCEGQNAKRPYYAEVLVRKHLGSRCKSDNCRRRRACYCKRISRRTDGTLRD